MTIAVIIIFFFLTLTIGFSMGYTTAEKHFLEVQMTTLDRFLKLEDQRANLERRFNDH